MKKGNKFLVGAIIIVTVLILSIIGVMIYAMMNNKKSGDYKLYKNVQIVDEKSIKKVEQVDDDIILANKNLGYKKGDVVVFGMSDVTPNGAIVKIKDVDKDGNEYIYHTQDATLEDVFEEAHIEKKFVISEDGVVDNTQADTMLDKIRKYDEVNAATTMAIENEIELEVCDGFTLSGSVAVELELEVKLDINHGKTKLQIVMHDTNTGAITAKAEKGVSDDFSKDIFSKKLPNIQFMIGPVPVVITNEFATTVEGSMSADAAAEVSTQIESKYVVGVDYDGAKGEVKEILEKEYSGEGMEWNAEAKVSEAASIAVKAHLISKFYDTAGADLSAGVEGNAEIEVRYTPKEKHNGLPYVGKAEMYISPVLAGELVVEKPVLDTKMKAKALFEKEFKPFWKKSWQSDENLDEESDADNSMDAKYEVFVPESEEDLIWDIETEDTGKTISYDALMDAYMKAEQSSNKKIHCESAGFDFTVVVPFKFEDNGHTYVVTRHFFLSENDLGNGRDCFQIYDTNDKVTYYLMNTLSPYADNDGNMILHLHTMK